MGGAGSSVTLVAAERDSKRLEGKAQDPCGEAPTKKMSVCGCGSVQFVFVRAATWPVWYKMAPAGAAAGVEESERRVATFPGSSRPRLCSLGRESG